MLVVAPCAQRREWIPSRCEIPRAWIPLGYRPLSIRPASAQQTGDQAFPYANQAWNVFVEAGLRVSGPGAIMQSAAELFMHNHLLLHYHDVLA